MARTITVTDEAYGALAKRKKHARDSFSKVILRLTGRPGDPLAAAGAWKDMTDAGVKELMARSRKDFETILRLLKRSAAPRSRFGAHPKVKPFAHGKTAHGD
jgi:predicted CopG family antitoxin